MMGRVEVAGKLGLGKDDFIEGHRLNATIAKRIPNDMIGVKLSQRKARELLRRIG